MLEYDWSDHWSFHFWNFRFWLVVGIPQRGKISSLGWMRVWRCWLALTDSPKLFLSLWDQRDGMWLSSSPLGRRRSPRTEWQLRRPLSSKIHLRILGLSWFDRLCSNKYFSIRFDFVFRWPIQQMKSLEMVQPPALSWPMQSSAKVTKQWLKVFLCK